MKVASQRAESPNYINLGRDQNSSGKFVSVDLRKGNRLRIILPDDAPGRLLHRERRLPGLVDVLLGHLGEGWDVATHVAALRVVALPEGHRRVHTARGKIFSRLRKSGK